MRAFRGGATIDRRCQAPVRPTIVAAALALLVAVALVATSCGGAAGPSSSRSATTARQTSGIRGIVLFAGGPDILSPSPLPGGFGSGRQGRPYRFVTVQVTVARGADKGHVVARIKPNADALFVIPLPPGAYVLKPRVPRNGPWPQATTVVVAPGRFSRTLVYVEGL